MKIIDNKKIIVSIVISLLLMISVSSGLLIWKKLDNKNIELEEVKLREDFDSNTFAIMIENEDGTYAKSSENKWPTHEFKYNNKKSGCLDENGNNLEGVLTFNESKRKASLKTRNVAYCYLYFDINKSVYQKVRSDYLDNKGSLLLEETSNDDYPVYYYQGDITNNNILYAGYCWKMVRTTDTGGVKLVYNGIPQTTSEGISCNNTGDATSIGKSAFNEKRDSMAYIGYMYNSDTAEIYARGTQDYRFSTSSMVVNGWPTSGGVYYADTATWDGTKYVLSNSDGSAVQKYSWPESYDNLVGYYTCKRNDTNCYNEVFYILNPSETRMGAITLRNGDKIENTMKFAKEVTDNGDGTYTLVNPIEVTRSKYYEEPTVYSEYYYCGDNLLNITCSAQNLHYSVKTELAWVWGHKIKAVYKYGKSFKYENGKYTLVDTEAFWDLNSNLNILNDHHYTCFNSSGECDKVSYAYYWYNFEFKLHYINLSDGKSVEDAIHEMLHADNVNQEDSTIKKFIDAWYAEKIKDKTDDNSKLYSSYLENTIWCSNRAVREKNDGTLDLGSLNPNGGVLSEFIFFNSRDITLSCKNKTDQFTLKVEKGGTDGYGNNTLDYPIGLLDYNEAKLTHLLGIDTTLLSPAFYASSKTGSGGGRSYQMAEGVVRGAMANYSNHSMNQKFNISPSVSLSINVDIAGGDGSYTNPYQIELAE